MMATDALRDTVGQLQTSAAALAILAAVIDARLNGQPLDRRLAPHAGPCSMRSASGARSRKRQRASCARYWRQSASFHC